MSVAGAAIGLTRGTGLMADSNSARRKLELSALPVLPYTISQAEMVFSLTALLHPLMVRRCLR